MKSDKKKWDSRYQTDAGSLTPAHLVTGYLHYASKGKALDLACGNGRNSFYLADNGFTVDSIDISSVAIDRIAERGCQGITATCRDLDTFVIPENHYDVIVNLKFLQRKLFPGIHAGLKSGGLLIFDSFIGNENQEYCLLENELLKAFQAFRIIYYEEKPITDSKNFKQSASLVAQKK